MMEDAEDNTYVIQLREVFDSCDKDESGHLNREELVALCNKLQLDDRTNLIVQHLLGENIDLQVNFEDFKEAFVHLLTQTSGAGTDDDDRIEGAFQQFSEQEVSPKFTFGKKKYGRRSRPASLANNDIPMHCSASDGLCPSNSAFSPSLQAEVGYVKQDVSDTTSNKRRVSIEAAQQPPNKSGRLSASFTAEFSTEKCFEAACNSKSIASLESNNGNTFQESNPEEYLQGIWKKLGVGEDGYLNIDELAYVCEHIGMEMSEEVVTQLFEKLDCDQDGKVSYEEFLQGLFQHGGPHTLSDSSESPLSMSPLHHKGIIYKDGSREDHKIDVGVESGFFSCIDPDKTGYAESSTLVELWESLEVTEGTRLLKELGFNTDQKINLQDLTSILEDELESSQSTSLYRCALLSVQNYIRYLRLNFDQLQAERDKLKEGITEANTRAALLAQEVDEHHAKLESSLQNKLIATEKKFQEQLRSLQEELQHEREALGIQSLSLKQQCQKDVDTIREEETKLKNHMDALKQENARLEQELQDVTERYMEAARLSEAQQKELTSAAELKQKVAELESCHDQQHQALLLEVENCRRLNKELQDRIDELLLELESVRHSTSNNNNSLINKHHHRTGSWLSDYKKASGPVSLKRRGSGSSTEENSDDDNPVAGKVRRRLLLHKDGQSKPTFDVEYLQENHKQELEKLKSKYEQAVTTMELSYQSKVTDLETQLERNVFSQDDINSVNSLKNQSRDEIIQTLCQVQENLQIQLEVRSSLEEEISELKKQIKQLSASNKFISSESDAMVSSLHKEFDTVILDHRNHLLENKTRSEDPQESFHYQKAETEYKFLEDNQPINKTLVEECKKQLPEKMDSEDIVFKCSLQHKSIAKLQEVNNKLLEAEEHTASNVANTFRQEICQVLQSLSSIGVADIQQLEDLVLQALNTIETQLRTFYLEEQGRLRQRWEEELTHLREKEVMEMSMQHKKEILDRSTSPIFEVKQPNNCDILIKEMYLENARLVRKLQLVEGQQQKTESNNLCLQYKCKVLSRLLKDISRAAVA